MSLSVFEAVAEAKVVVAGDVILDRFIEGEVTKISPEAPVGVLTYRRESVSLGGAANVAANLAAYGAAVRLFGAVGDDKEGRDLLALCEALPGARAELLVDSTRPTTVKTRFLGGWHQLLRVDAEARHDLPAAAADALLAGIKGALGQARVLVLSDYDKGVLPAAFLPRLIAEARALGAQVIVDPKKRDPSLFAGASLLKPNVEEMALFTGLRPASDDEAEAACRLLMERSGAEAVLLTRGGAGMTLVRGDTAGALHVHPPSRRVFDVTGAGDTVIATLAAVLAAGGDLESGVTIASAAAGVAVSKPGTAIVSLAELREALTTDTSDGAVPWSEAARLTAEWRAAGLSVGFTNGCFDLLHRGHLYSLSQAAQRVDRLVVGLNSDASTRALKGDGRPVQDEATRAAVLSALRFVDLVVLFEEATPAGLVAHLKPDVLFKGADYEGREVAGSETVLASGGRVELIPLLDGHSTTRTVGRMREGD